MEMELKLKVVIIMKQIILLQKGKVSLSSPSLGCLLAEAGRGWGGVEQTAGPRAWSWGQRELTCTHGVSHWIVELPTNLREVSQCLEKAQTMTILLKP